MSLNEADTRAKLIDPKLHSDGWDENLITREYYFTKGKIFLEGDKINRKKPKKADYILMHNEAFPLAVVEAKNEGKRAQSGIQQAKDYAERLGLLFAYSSNGHEIEEFDYITNKQATMSQFPKPEALFEKYLKFFSLKKENIEPILYPFNTKLYNEDPRYYIQSAVRQAITSIINGKKRVLLNLATGTGKTSIAFQIVWKLTKSNKAKKVLFLADRNVLRDQAYNTFVQFGNARSYIKDGKAPTSRDIYFSIYQAMWSEKNGKRVFENYPKDYFDLIIIDECHRSGFGSWNEILQHFSGAIHLGMTATPKQDENINTYKYFGDPDKGYKPVYEYSMAQGIDDGFLANFTLKKVKLNIDSKGLKIEDAVKEGAKVEIPVESQPSDFYKMDQFEKEIILPDRTEKMCNHLASLIKTYGEMQKTIVFCVTMDHAEEVAKNLQNSFSYLGYPNYAVRIVSEESDSLARLKIFQDKEAKVPVVATTVDLLSTGFDAPTVHNIVFMKPITSPLVFKQIMGRGSRTFEDKGKLMFRVIDYTNATRLIDEWIEGPPRIEEEGLLNNYLNGVVVEEETLEPINGALLTVQLSPNNQEQSKTNEKGEFVLKELPAGKIKLYVTAGGYKRRETSVDTQPNLTLPIQIELRKQKVTPPPIVVKGLTIYIEDETMFEVEILGKRLTIKEYVDYAKDEIAKLALSEDDLRNKWIKESTRSPLIKKLETNGINLKMLANILKNTQADEFDILSNISFGSEIHTRKERAEALRNIQQKYFESYTEKQQEIIRELLLKYEENGVTELTKADIFNLTPLPGFTQSQKIFGTSQKLRKSVDNLQERIYSK